MIDNDELVEQVNNAINQYETHEDRVEATVALLLTCFHVLRLQVGDDVAFNAIEALDEQLDGPNPFSMHTLN